MASLPQFLDTYGRAIAMPKPNERVEQIVTEVFQKYSHFTTLDHASFSGSYLTFLFLFIEMSKVGKALGMGNMHVCFLEKSSVTDDMASPPVYKWKKYAAYGKENFLRQSNLFLCKI